MTGLKHDRANEAGSEFQAQTEVGPLLRGFENSADGGQLDGCKCYHKSEPLATAKLSH